jgi:hypothetical protein
VPNSGGFARLSSGVLELPVRIGSVVRITVVNSDRFVSAGRVVSGRVSALVVSCRAVTGLGIVVGGLGAGTESADRESAMSAAARRQRSEDEF